MAQTETQHSQQTGRTVFGTLWVRCTCGELTRTLVDDHAVGQQIYQRHCLLYTSPSPRD